MICGDLNAQTATNADYVVDDTSDHVHVLPADDYQTDIPMHRMSEDKGFNNFGSNLLDFCKHTGYRILNGRVGQDKTLRSARMFAVQEKVWWILS